MSTWPKLLAAARVELARAGVASPDAEARWLIERLAVDDEPVSARAVARLDGMLARRTGGEPLQYVLGAWDFRGLDLLVDRRVLIPRPETEVTAQVAIDALTERGERRGRADPWGGGVAAYTVADLGTGSGAIALALAAELPDAMVWATDNSDDALAVARANLAGAGTLATRVRLTAGRWYDALPDELRGRLRLVVSNPPYVAESEYGSLPAEVRDYEPQDALVSGPTGLEAIEMLVSEASAWLEPGGAFVCEIAPHQAAPAAALARAAGLVDVGVARDLVGRHRVLRARALG
jgi:release factor glutamine methyltransferase